MARVYRIVGDNGVYIGSTKEPLHERFRKHFQEKEKCKSKLLINPKIELIEECTEEERYIREQYWIDNTECVNFKKAYTGLSQKEYQQLYRQQHKDERKEYDANRDRTKMNEKRRVKIDCPCGGRYSHGDRARHFRSKLHQNYLQ
jgi:hypothetical protein